MLVGGIFGVSFLTPLGGLFALAMIVPLAALVVTERRSERVRALLGVVGPGRRTLVPVAVALVLLPVLVGVAAAQPVVVRQKVVHERGDAQAYFVFDTSRSMLASSGFGKPNRLARAKRLARRVRAALGNVPVGIVSLTDRALPDLMPTTDPALFAHTLVQSVGIDEPPPSQPYKLGRATSFEALVPLAMSHFFSEGVRKRLVVVFTDGETSPVTPLLGIGLQRKLSLVFVHVWQPGEQIFGRDGRPDPHYSADVRSVALLQQAAEATGGSVFTEQQVGRAAAEARRIVGHGALTAHVNAYARDPLAQWFALAGVLPLAFLLWRRNA
jgi:VWA domain-containing protein